MNNPYLSYYDPYAGFDFSGGYSGYNPQGDHLANLEAQRRREEEERERNQQSWNNFSNDLMDYMSGGEQGTAQAAAANPYAGAAPGMVAGAPAVNAAGGTLQASMAAPLAQAAPLGSTGIGGGSVMGPMSFAPTGGASMIGGAGTGGAVGGTVGGSTAGGAGAGSAAAGAGAGALGMASLIAAPVALGLGAANWANNTHDDVTWGTHLTNPAKGSGAVAENIDTKITNALGDNVFGQGVADFVNSPQKIIAPGSPGEWVEGVGDALLINQTNDLLSGAWDWLSGLFG